MYAFYHLKSYRLSYLSLGRCSTQSKCQIRGEDPVAEAIAHFPREQLNLSSSPRSACQRSVMFIRYSFIPLSRDFLLLPISSLHLDLQKLLHGAEFHAKRHKLGVGDGVGVKAVVFRRESPLDSSSSWAILFKLGPECTHRFVDRGQADGRAWGVGHWRAEDCAQPS
jgi:hypothetical protein